MSVNNRSRAVSLWLLYTLRTMEFTTAYVRPPGTCLDSMYAIPGHTMCIATSHQHPIHSLERRQIENVHDDIRANVTPRASNMLELVNTFSYALAKAAQIWVEQCKFTHDEPHLRRFPGRYTVGQNILVSNNSLKWQQVIETWATEKKEFHYGQTNDINVVGNYVQLINAETVAVGCGMTLCSGIYYYVCNYAPSVDIGVNLDRPYEVSASGLGADECPLHSSNISTSPLCDCGGLICLNGGTVNLTTCLCDCPPDNTNLRYDNKFCEITCEPPTDPMSCQNKNKGQCSTDAETFLTCPWLCNVCPYVGMNYTQGDVTMPWTTTVAPTTYTTSHITTKAVSGNGLAKGQTGNNGGIQFVTTAGMMAACISVTFLK